MEELGTGDAPPGQAEPGACSRVASAADPRVTLSEPLPSRALSGSLCSLSSGRVAGDKRAFRLWDAHHIVFSILSIPHFAWVFFSFFFFFFSLLAKTNLPFYFSFNFNPTLPDMNLIPLTRGWWGHGAKVTGS